MKPEAYSYDVNFFDEKCGLSHKEALWLVNFVVPHFLFDDGSVFIHVEQIRIKIFLTPLIKVCLNIV